MLVLKIPKEYKQMVIRNIQSYFDDELSETIGELAAENLLDFMIKQLGPTIYNQAIRDARAVVIQQMERVDDEIYALEQSVELRHRD
ncbi:DUF2164 domain-containing protein [Alicyclobacillus fastidiosus]|uniref:DUF2164 domain-containing protein n=1 Tax=Alicyclobacillus fastidiosus TaxID=392011 RepID=A0ABY6ZCD2_9BACL|nr:DUF2164 domain-containing protein [Alicyclobacillus fastidiosus]WAH40545.1 DUF2164 domain-containing protein [Alicyclobacillus fastidiosus]GMA61977.1 hypothetical protein GCM10025859_24170 [Alicyclobacillus fastidiosus]